MTEIKRRRKPGELQKEKAAAALREVVAAYVLSHGGAAAPRRSWEAIGDPVWEFTLPTIAGELSLTLHKTDPHSVFMRFEDVDRAKEKLHAGVPGVLNGYSGKWNFHHYPDGYARNTRLIRPLAEVVQEWRAMMSSVILPEFRPAMAPAQVPRAGR